MPSVTVVDLLDLSEVIDNTAKCYESCIIHGFRINYEPEVFDKNPLLRETIEEDCAEVCIYSKR